MEGAKMTTRFLVSDDGRILTDEYLKDGKTRICLSERTFAGTLISEFDGNFEVVDQVYIENTNNKRELESYLNMTEKEDVPVGTYKGIIVKAKCKSCNSVGLQRNLDFIKPLEIKEVTIVPLYRCLGCGSIHYSMTNEYLKKLINEKSNLFETDEMAEIKTGGEDSVKTLQEYIIRIFASKKISKLKVV